MIDVAALVQLLDFEKGGGVIPTIVCDAADGAPRMLAYSSPASLEAALREEAGIYWSRSRKALWRKGETSGNVQRLVSAAIDCDRDALIFYVEQRGDTCHLQRATCFTGPAPFTWQTLAERVRERAGGFGTRSYTRQLLADPGMLRAKIVEEALELTEAHTREHVAWECADLLYFMTVKMQRAGIGIADVMRQLEERAS